MSFSTNDSACSPRPISSNHRLTRSDIRTARSLPAHQFNEKRFTFVSLLCAPHRPLAVTSAEGLDWVASRRWVATDGFHRLNGGRRPQPAVRRTWKPTFERPDLMQL